MKTFWSYVGWFVLIMLGAMFLSFALPPMPSYKLSCFMIGVWFLCWANDVHNKLTENKDDE